MSPVHSLGMAMVLVTVCAAASGAPSGGSESPMQTAQVELEVFSGRPNPSWSLSAAEVEALAGMLQALSPAAAVPPADGLGYRGIVVTFGDGGPLGLRGLRAYRGLTLVDAAGATSYREDPERRVERWLLASGKPYLEPGLYAEIEAELGPDTPGGDGARP